MKSLIRMLIGLHLLTAASCAKHKQRAIDFITAEMKNELIGRVGVEGAIGGNIKLTSMTLLGTGAQGFVHPGETDTGIPVAIKFSNESTALIERELNCYAKMNATTNRECTKYGIPFIYHTGTMLNYKTMVMTKLDTDLTSLHEKIGPFSMETILIIFRDLIRILKYMHSKGIINVDIKPNNIMVKGANLFIIDYTLCEYDKASRNPIRGGSRIYRSIAVHLGALPAEYDDMESLFYSMLALADGKLPWGHPYYFSLTDKQILEYKQRATIETLCSHLKIPDLIEPFTQFYVEVKSSAQEKRLPEYDFLYKIFNDALYSGRNRSERIVFKWLTVQQRLEAMTEDVPSIESIVFPKSPGLSNYI